MLRPMPSLSSVRAAGVCTAAKDESVFSKTTRLARDPHQYAYRTRPTFLRAWAFRTKHCSAIAPRCDLVTGRDRRAHAMSATLLSRTFFGTMHG